MHGIDSRFGFSKPDDRSNEDGNSETECRQGDPSTDQ